MKKKAVVLLVTLGFIATITAIVLQTVSISKKSLDDLMGIKRQNQLMLVLKDSTKIIDTINQKGMLEYFLDQDIPPFSDKKSKLTFSFTCKNLSNRFDINKLLDCKSYQCKEVFLNYAKENNLDDEDFFYKLLKNRKKNMPHKKLVNFVDIQKIKDIYLKEVQDFDIEKITKSNFYDVFYFLDKDSSDTNTTAQPESKVCKILGYEKVGDDCTNNFHLIIKNYPKPYKKQNTRKSKNSEKNKLFYTKNLIECKINLYNGDIVDEAIYKYDIKTKKIVGIDEFF